MPRFRGAIFDVDGVLVDSPHEKAWRESLRELMESGWSDIRDRTTWSPDAFTSRVYEEQMSGKPRMSGARAALEYFHIPDDEEEHRLLEYAERKQAMVVRLIEAGDFTAYPDALRFIIGVKDAGLRVAAASSSKNAELFLGAIGIARRDDAQLLAAAGADIVEKTVDEVDLAALSEGRLAIRPHPAGA
jgi:beta-phosphoglucomutase